MLPIFTWNEFRNSNSECWCFLKRSKFLQIMMPYSHTSILSYIQSDTSVSNLRQFTLFHHISTSLISTCYSDASVRLYYYITGNWNCKALQDNYTRLCLYVYSSILILSYLVLIKSDMSELTIEYAGVYCETNLNRAALVKLLQS